MCTRIRATCTHTCTIQYTLIYIHLHLHTHMHSCTHILIHTCKHTNKHMHVHTHKCTHTCAHCIHRHIHMYIQTHTHLYNILYSYTHMRILTFHPCGLIPKMVLQSPRISTVIIRKHSHVIYTIYVLTVYTHCDDAIYAYEYNPHVYILHVFMIISIIAGLFIEVYI